MNVIDASKLYFAYARESVLAGFSLGVEPGEVVGLLGRNGAGKTTLLHLALGMLKPADGSIRLFGEDPCRKPVEVRRRIGYVAETQTFPGRLKVAHILDLHRQLYPTWDDDWEAKLLGQFGLDPRRRIRTLSKGQARQVALVCAVAHRPELLLLDEPAGGLDPLARRIFLETSVELLSEEGTTIVFSTHQTLDLERMASRVVMLDAGKVRLDEPFDDLRESNCLAVYPEALGPEALGDHASVRAWRRKRGMIHAVLAEAPDTAQARLAAATGQNIACRPLPLEELFIELLEERS